MIDDVKIDVDGGYGEDGSKTKASLTICGDFVDECEEYLDDETTSEVTFELPYHVAESLYKQLREIL